MPQSLSKSGISESSTIQSSHVTQLIDALKGTEAFALTISGSLTLSDDTIMQGTSSNAELAELSTVATSASSSLSLKNVNTYDSNGISSTINAKYVQGTFSLTNESSSEYAVSELNGKTLGTDAFGSLSYIGAPLTSSLSLQLTGSNLVVKSNENIISNIMWQVFYY